MALFASQPAFIQTRWRYDYCIFEFALRNVD
jgi:hypothetical protein